jgi:hypothetical protein
MSPYYLPAIALLTLNVSTVFADVTEREAIQSQLASAMASADYATKKCSNLKIDQDKIESLVKRSGMTVAQLKASEEYTEQRDVLLGMEKGEQSRLICFVLSSAHGGYARDVIMEK